MSTTTTLIQSVLQASKRTFARSRNKFKLKEDEFLSSLRDLKCLLDNVRAQDLGKNLKMFSFLKGNPDLSFTGLERSRVLSGTGFFQQEEAPCTYIKIHEDLDVSLGVFIIKPGFKIPLHNHPKMHGLLKVVHGQVDISVYTKTNLTEATEIPPFLRDRTHLIDQGFVFPTTKEKLKSITSGNEAVILSPGNLTTFFFIFGKKKNLSNHNVFCFFQN